MNVFVEKYHTYLGSFNLFRINNYWRDFRITPYIYYAHSSLFDLIIAETIALL